MFLGLKSFSSPASVSFSHVVSEKEVTASSTGDENGVNKEPIVLRFSVRASVKF